ncbi:MAG: 30S ribosome-binding factor RbfA [Candidatus Aminicenantes bacterium]|nr:30S ribosome-binding factor RbfA [Candidatus Aminicenantes bacterium]
MRTESRRQKRMASLLREALGDILPSELRSYPTSLVSVTRVEIPADLRSARVLLSIFGPAEAEEIRGHLERRTGAIRHRLAAVAEFKYNPQLVFALDSSAEDVERISRILEEKAHDDNTTG